MSQNQNRRILIVDDDPVNLDLLQQVILKENYEVRTTPDSSEGLIMARDWKPALILLDQDMPEMTGLEVMKSVKKDFTGVDIMFMSGDTSPQMVSQALEQGADDYLRKPFSLVELVSRLHVRFRIRDLREDLQKVNEQLEQLSVTDDLTGLLNMRTMYDRIDYELKRANRTNRTVSCVMIDLDHFKNVNDLHDHLFGSFVIKETGQVLKLFLRETDFAARYGGDEFLIVLNETDEAGTRTFCMRLLEKIRKYKFTDKDTSVKLTLSLGYAVGGTQFPGGARELVRCADHALYMSKQRGRNQINGFGAGAAMAHAKSLRKKSV